MIKMFFIICSIICFLYSFYLIKKEPRSIFNGFVVQLALVLLVLSTFIDSKYGSISYDISRIILICNYLVIFIIGVCLIINNFFVVKREGLNLTKILPFVFGCFAVFVSYIGYVEITSGVSGSELFVFIMSFLYNVTLFLPFSFGSVFIYTIIYFLLPKRKNYDYIIVLGCGIKSNGDVTPLLKGRVDKAMEFYNKNSSSKIIVSGGQGSDEIISEALAMKNYLVSKGIPKSSIIVEDKSTNTEENLIFSKKKMKEDTYCLISTSNYHTLRAALLSKKLGLNAQGIGSFTALYYFPAAFFREYIALVFNNKLIILFYILLAFIMAF